LARVDVFAQTEVEDTAERSTSETQTETETEGDGADASPHPPPANVYFTRASFVRATIPSPIAGCASIGDGLCVDRSRIRGAGLGLFATRFFARGTKITWYEGERITLEEADRRRRLKCATHIIRLGSIVMDARLVEPLNGLGGASWANSCCEAANVVFRELNQHIYIEAKWDIFPGDEICPFYRFE
jgi:hypothetical protein